jgi:hypothetical protein
MESRATFDTDAFNCQNDSSADLPKIMLALGAESNNSAFISNDILYSIANNQLYTKGHTHHQNTSNTKMVVKKGNRGNKYIKLHINVSFFAIKYNKSVLLLIYFVVFILYL